VYAVSNLVDRECPDSAQLHLCARQPVGLRPSTRPMMQPVTSISSLIDVASAALRTWSGGEARWFAAAPGRINLIGEHTDYNAGWVLPMAIDRYTLLAAAPGAVAGTVRAYSLSLEEQGDLPLEDLSTAHAFPWMRYVQGVVAEYATRGIESPALDVVIVSSLPAGGGLSSSAALELATAHLLQAVVGQSLSVADRIQACVAAEREYAGVPCGVMDQTIVERGLEGHALLLDCGRDVATPIPLSGESVAMIAIHCGVAHELAQGAYAQRREECATAAKMLGVATLRDATSDALVSLKSEDTLYRRARHVVTENERVRLAVAALKNGDWSRLGRLMLDSHMSLKEDYAVSCDELDLLVDLALAESGVYGARMTGGGFGGCMIVLADRARAEAVADAICSRYGAQTGREPLCYQLESAAGAGELCATL